MLLGEGILSLKYSDNIDNIDNYRCLNIFSISLESNHLLHQYMKETCLSLSSCL